MTQVDDRELNAFMEKLTDITMDDVAIVWFRG